MSLELRRPCSELASSFAEMRDACMAAGDDRWSAASNIAVTAIAHTDVAAYIDLLNNWAQGRELPEGWVPSDEFWIVKDGTVVGEIGVRHKLTFRLRKVGGHIGYHVRPDYRNQGIATFALRQALRVLALLGEREALLTCRDDNAASVRVIEKCGGVRIDDSTANGPKRRRYVIALEDTHRSL